MKNRLTPAGIEPATFRFVAQHLNHCATAVPSEYYVHASIQYLTVDILYKKKKMQLSTVINPTSVNVHSPQYILHFLFLKDGEHPVDQTCDK